MYKMKLVLYIFLAYLSTVHSKTVRKVLKTCDGIERRIIGERLIGEDIRGQILCRYAPKESGYTLAANFNSLSLKKQGYICPVLKLIGYTSMMKQTDLDEDNRINPGRAIEIPADPENIITISCQNYTSVVGTMVTAKKLGQKFQLEFNTMGTTELQKRPFDMTLFSYKPGLAYSCPSKHFRCWSDKYMCIDETLECDSEKNCADNSDEDNFKCTGRIGALPLGMFVVVVALALLLFICSIIGIIVYRRRQLRRKEEQRANRPYGIPMDSKSAHPFIDPTMPREYSAYPPEA